MDGSESTGDVPYLGLDGLSIFFFLILENYICGDVDFKCFDAANGAK